MDERDFDRDLLPVARRVGYLGKQVGIDLRHKAALRSELLARHSEIRSRRRNRWFALPSGFRTLTLSAPALALAVALSVLLPDFRPGGQISPGTAEAARIAMAAARTVPTVTSWRVTLRRIKGNTATATNCYVPLRAGERLYTRGEAIYLFDHGSWYRVTAQGKGSCARWQYQFLSVPAGLPSKKVATYRNAGLAGRTAEVVSYSSHSGGKTITVEAWISPRSGLVLRLVRSVSSRGRVLETELADYTYQQSSP